MEYSIGSAALVSYPVECLAYSRIDFKSPLNYLRSSNHVNARNLFIRSVIQIFIYTDFHMFRRTSEWTAVVPTFNTHRNTFFHPSNRSEGWTYCHHNDRMEVQPEVWSSLLSYFCPHDLPAIRMTFCTSVLWSGWPAVWMTGSAIITTVIHKKICRFPKVPTIAGILPEISSHDEL